MINRFQFRTKDALWVSLLLVTLGSALAIGTVHVATLLVLSCFVGLIFLFFLRYQWKTKIPTALPFCTKLFWALSIYSLVQSIPIPIEILRRIGSANADVWSRALFPFGSTSISWAPISVDPGASTVEALKWFVYGVVYWLGRFISREKGFVWNVLLVALNSLVIALVTLGHGIVGATHVFGIYTSIVDVAIWHVGPFLNPNNLSGFLNLGTFCWMGLLLQQKPIFSRWILGVAVSFTVGMSLTSGSRGGAATLLLGLVALGFLYRHYHQNSTSQRVKWLTVATVVLGVSLAYMGMNDDVWKEIQDRDLGKLQRLYWIKEMAMDHLWFGIGRGSFESVSSAYSNTPGHFVRVYAEHFVLQWIVEWGVLIGAVAVVGTIATLVPRTSKILRGQLHLSVLVGVSAFLIHNLVDLALEIPGICVSFFALVGGLDIHRKSSSELVHKSRYRVQGILWGVFGFALLPSLVWMRGRADVTTDRNKIAALIGEKEQFSDDERQLVRALLKEAMLRHPAEPYFSRIGAWVAWKSGDQNPIPWIQRTLERNRMESRCHLILSSILAKQNAKPQALLELRLASENDSHRIPSEAARMALQLSRDKNELMKIVPDGKQGGIVLSKLAEFSPTEDPSLRFFFDREAVLRDGYLYESRIRQANDLTMQLANGNCVDAIKCEQEITNHIEVVAQRDLQSSLSVRMHADLLVAQKKSGEALKLLREECDHFIDVLSCEQRRLTIAVNANATTDIDEAANDVLRHCGSTEQCAQVAEWVGGIRNQRGELNFSLLAYQKAAKESPTLERWVRVADVASRAGKHAIAVEALLKAMKMPGANKSLLQQKIDAEKAATMTIVH